MFPGKTVKTIERTHLQTGMASMISAFEKLPVFWRLQFAGWGALAIYTFFTRASFWESYATAAVLTIILEPAGVVISTGLRLLYRAIRLGRENVGKVIIVIVASSGLAALIQLGIGQLGNLALGRMGLNSTGGPPLGVRMVFFWVIFAAWSFAYLWIKAEIIARAEEKQHRAAASAAQRAELEMLRLQLNPHFLFNSLTNIVAEIREHPDDAVEMTMRLADYLRYSLEHQDELIVPLSHEIDAMKNYLGIEKSRFNNRLRVTLPDFEHANRIMVPCFLLQPLVENAVKHGLTTSSPPWDLSVHIHHENGALRILVSNTGILSKSWETGPRPGTGLVNLRRRLELHYPARHSFNLRQDEALVIAELELNGEAALL